MAFFNKTVLLGNIVRNPELRYTPGSNLPVARTALAVNSKRGDKEDTMFIDIVVFGKLAEVLNSYATQGTQILIEGRLTQSRWEQDGVKRSKHEVIVDTFQLLGSGKRSQNDDNEGMYNSGRDSFKEEAGSADDEDIPF